MQWSSLGDNKKKCNFFISEGKKEEARDDANVLRRARPRSGRKEKEETSVRIVYAQRGTTTFGLSRKKRKKRRDVSAVLEPGGLRREREEAALRLLVAGA